MRHLCLAAAFLAALSWGASAEAAIDTVYAVNPAGDNFTNAGTSNTGSPLGEGWYYNNVRNNGIVGVNGNYPQSGNGSVYLSGSVGPGGNSSKADVEFLASATANLNGNYSPGAPLGVLGQLSSFAYDWYRDSSSTNSDVQHPSLRLQVVDPQNLAVSGYLVFERAYNGDLLDPPNPSPSPLVPTDTWVSDDVFAGDYRLWSTGTLPSAGVTVGSRTLSQWMNDFRSYLVIGISSGFGSGWGPFEGAVDNITFGFNGDDTTYNFEVSADGVVPEPMTLAVWSVLGLCGSAFAWRAKRRQLAA